MGSPLKTFVALLVMLALVVFVCADTYADIQLIVEETEPYYQPQPDIKERRLDTKLEAIIPEEPMRLERDDESGEDAKGQRGRKDPKNAQSITQKREYHRKMMLR